MANEAIRIFDVAFVVTSQIERAPQWTMIRELTMNALEAASQAAGDKIVHWTFGSYEGYRKAAIWNTGPGMSAAQLKDATDLACTIDKSLGLDENFGVGAKVSSLASNRHGMRFRSCKAGRVSEVMLGYDPDQKLYVRFERDVGGKRDVVIDVTAAAVKDGRDTSIDWTEVMLLGNSAEQDTAARPFATQPTDKNYIATALYRRFYRLPTGVRLRIDSIYHRLDGTRPLIPLGQRYEKFPKVASLPIPETGMTIHYLHDPALKDRSGNRTSASNALGSTTTTCCLIHKNEMYSVMTGNQWSAAAPRFGISFGSKELCVHIELDENDARPSQYRERLISKHTGEDIVPEDYALWVKDYMPEWVKEVIRDASPRRTEDYSDIRKELQELLNKYKVRVTGRVLDPDRGEPSNDQHGEDTLVEGIEGQGKGGSSNSVGSRTARPRFHAAPDGATTTKLYDVYEKPPQIEMLVEREDIIEKGLNGRAANFVLETGVLFVNGLYEAVDRTVEDVEPDFVGQADPESVRELVVDAARREMALRVGRATVYALAKRANEHWDRQAMVAALTKESLSIAADNYAESLNAVRRQVREGMKLATVAA